MAEACSVAFSVQPIRPLAANRATRVNFLSVCIVLISFLRAVPQCRRRLPLVSGLFTRTAFTCCIANGGAFLTRFLHLKAMPGGNAPCPLDNREFVGLLYPRLAPGQQGFSRALLILEG